MTVDNDFTRVPDSDVDRDSPLIQRVTRAWTSNQNHALALTRSDGSAICTGTADSVTNVANSVVTDAAPSGGAVANVQASMVMEVVDGDAIGTFATVLSTGASTITVDANLYAAGMRAGDTYRILYGVATDMAHTHDGVDSAPVDIDDLAGTIGVFQEYTESGKTQSGTSGSHTLVLPAGNHLLVGRGLLSCSASGADGDAADADITMTVDGVTVGTVACDADSVDMTYDDSDQNDCAVFFNIIVSNGDVVAFSGNTNTVGSSTASISGSFTIEGYFPVAS